MADYASSAKEALQREETCTTACVFALYCLYENNWLLWEPETIWLELKHKGIDVSLGNRQQIMAGRSLITTGRFWYDATAFEVASIAFNNEHATFFGGEDAPVAFLNWAVYEADALHFALEQEHVVFDREPIAYMGVQLFREGFVVPPQYLNVAQSELARHLPKETNALAATIREAWAQAPKGDKLLNAPFPETPEGVQLARLAAVQVYFDKRFEEREKQIAPFVGCLP